LSVTVLLGIAGVVHSQTHAKATGLVVSEMAPNQIGALTLMLLENTPLYRDALTGAFQLPDQQQLLEELKTLVENIHLDRVQFQTNHASNYLPINGRLSRDKNEILESGDWEALERNYLDKHAAVNNTARALTENGLSFIAAQNLHT
jgi:hypothetical protein